MTVNAFNIRIMVILTMLFSGLITPGFAQNLDGVKEILKEGFEQQSLPINTEWGSIRSFAMPRKHTMNTVDRIMKAKNIIPVDQFEQYGFKKYLMSKDTTQACRFLVEMAIYNSCPPLEIVLVNPHNITEFITISKEVKTGYISEPHAEKTLLPAILKQLEDLTGDQKDNGITTTIALIENPSLRIYRADPRIAYTSQIILTNGEGDALRYYEQNIYVLTRNGYIGISIFNTKFFNKEKIDQLIERIIAVSSTYRYVNASMFDFNNSNITAKDFLIFE